MEIINKRYQLREQLAATIYSKMYKAFDLQTETICTVHIYNETINKDFIEDFSCKFLKYQQLNYPMILADYDFDIIEEDGGENRYFYVCEYIGNNQKLDYKKLNLTDRLKILEKIIYSLKYIHFQRLAYKELEFDNIYIFVNQEGEIDIKLESFATILNNQFLMHKTGARLYTSGENNEDSKLIAKDIADLANIVYYLITAKDNSSFNLQITADIKPQFPLLHKALLSAKGSYEYRPNNCDQIWQALQHELNISADFWDKPYYQKIKHKVDYIGQREQLSLVENLIADYYYKVGDINTVFISSALGVGKTRFLEEISFRLRIKGFVVINCNQELYKSSGINYGYFAYIAKQLLKQFSLPLDFVTKHGQEIAKLEPKIASKIDIEDVKFLSSAESQLKLANFTLRLINECARMHSFVLLIDDIASFSELDFEILNNLIIGQQDNCPFLLLSLNQISTKVKRYKFKKNVALIELERFNQRDTFEYLKNKLFIDDADAKMLARGIYPVVHGHPKSIESFLDYLIDNEYIYISEERKYVIEEFTIADIAKAFEKEMQVMEAVFAKLSDNAAYLAKLFAVYGHGFNDSFGKELSAFSDSDFQAAIEELLKVKILHELISARESYYDFYDYNILILAYIRMSDAEKVAFHQRCQQYYQKQQELNDAEFDSYVFHLKNANHKELAVSKILERIDLKRQQREYAEILDYLSMASNIEAELDDIKMRLELLLLEAESRMEFGDFNDLFVIYRKVLSLSQRDDLLEYRVKALLKIAVQDLVTRKLDRYRERYRELLAISARIGGLDIGQQMEIKLLNLRYLKIQKQYATLKSEAELLLNTFDETVDRGFYYLTRYYLAIAYYKLDNFTIAFQIIEELIATMDGSQYPRHLIRCYNLMAEISYYTLYENKKAYDHLLKAKTLIEKHNLQRQNCLVYLNLARVLESLSQTEDAYSNYLLAERIAYSTKQFNRLFEVLNDIIALLIRLGFYQLAENKLAFFEQASKEEEYHLESRQYYYNLLLQANIYLAYKDFDKVEYYLDSIQNHGLIELDSYQKTNYFITQFADKYLLSLAGKDSCDISDLASLAKVLHGPAEMQIYSNFILHLAVESYALEDIDFCRQVIELMAKVDYSYDLEIKAIKDAFVSLLNQDKNLRILKALLFRAKKSLGRYIWKLYYIVGSYERKQKRLHEAIFFYYAAMDKYWDSISNFTETNKVDSINNNILYNRLVDDLNIICQELYQLKPQTALQFYREKGEKLRYAMLDDPDFYNVIGAIYILLNNKYLSDVNAFLASMSDDNIQNIENMLLFFIHLTFSERGYLIIVDEDGNKLQSFSAMEERVPAIVDNYIANINRSEDYIFVKRNPNAKNNINSDNIFDSSNDKSILVFPICRIEYNKLDFNRKVDRYTDSKENVIAYVYLESSWIFNQLNLNNLVTIRSYDGLNTLIINNYIMYMKSSIDKLTAVFNRSIVEKYVDSIIYKMRGINYNFALFMIDIDKFKQVNDRFGHRRGDEVLAKLGQTLKSSLRKNDVVGRYGGEEFIVIINNIGKGTAAEIAEKLRLAVENAKLLGHDGSLTISLGVSSYPQDGDNFGTLVENADKALYQSKNNGRNRVTVYSESMQSKHEISTNTGVFGTDASENAIKINTIIKLLALISMPMSREEKLNKILELGFDTIGGDQLFILLPNSELITVDKYASGEFKQQLENDFKEYLLSASEGGFYVDWGNEAIATDSRRYDNKKLNKDRKAYAFSKIVKNGQDCGVLLALSSLENKQYSYKDYSYMSSIASIIATVLED